MEDFKVINTEKIQLQSLKNFMHELGYSWFNVDKVFYSPFQTNKARVTVSLRNAVLLHNGHYFEWHGKIFNPPFDNIPAEWIASAMKAKIVQTVHLQHCKKKGNYIKAQKHLVKFVEKENSSLLLKL